MAAATPHKAKEKGDRDTKELMDTIRKADARHVKNKQSRRRSSDAHPRFKVISSSDEGSTDTETEE
jgi:hypothetical protein